MNRGGVYADLSNRCLPDGEIDRMVQASERVLSPEISANWPTEEFVEYIREICPGRRVPRERKAVVDTAQKVSREVIRYGKDRPRGVGLL